jgi:hypothetical protein
MLKLSIVGKLFSEGIQKGMLFFVAFYREVQFIWNTKNL